MFQHLRSIHKDVVYVIALLWSAATIVSLIKGALGITLYAVPNNVFGFYAWLRDSIFDGLSLILSAIWNVGISLPNWAEDILSLYTNSR